MTFDYRGFNKIERSSKLTIVLGTRGPASSGGDFTLGIGGAIIDIAPMAKAASFVKRSERGERTRKALLDAAERAFGFGGYAGASLREIAGDAGVPLGVVHYHFKDKEDLFREAVLRKQAQVMDLVEESFVDAERANAPARLTVQQVIECFLRPFLATFIEPGHELRDYVRMTSHMMSSYRVGEVRDVLRGLNRITEPLERRLKALVPEMREQDFYAALYILEAAIIFMEQDVGFIDDLTRGHHNAERLDQLIAPTALLFSGGIAALLGKADETHKRDLQIDRPPVPAGEAAPAFWLTESQWRAIQPLLPNKSRGVARVDDRRIISGIVHVLGSGCLWAKAPRDYGPAKTLYNRYRRWEAAGVWPAVFAALAANGGPVLAVVRPS